MLTKLLFAKTAATLLAVCLTVCLGLGIPAAGYAQDAKPEEEKKTRKQKVEVSSSVSDANKAAPGNPPGSPTADTDSLLLFAPIVVTATRVEQDLRYIPMSVSVVGEKAIAENPSSKVAEQFVDVPGVSYSSGKGGPGNNSMISIRGLEAGRVLYLIDGVRQNSIFKEDMNKGLMNIDQNDIERIEIIKGPASSLYGSDAIGGVVNIITKKGGNGKPFGFQVGSIMDSSNMSIEPRVAAFGDYDGFSYRVSGSGTNANDRRLAQGGKADNSSYTTESFFGQAGYKWDGGSVNFTTQHYDSDVKEMSSLYSWDEKKIVLYDKDDPRLTYLASFPKNERNTYTGALSLDNLSENLAKLSFTGFYQQRDTIQEGKNANGHTGYNNRLQDLSDLYGGTLQTDWALFDSHLVSLGAEFTRENVTNKSVETTGPQEYQFEGSQQTIGLFLQDEWNIIEDVTITTGIRQSWTKTSLDHDDKQPGYSESVDDSSLVGNIGVVYKGFENFAIRAQYSQGYRIPDLASQFTGTGIYLKPNPDLKPEKSYNYEVGVRYNDDNLSVDTSVFYNKIDDVMTTRVIGYIPGTVWSLNETVNAATYESYGVELATSYRIPGTGFMPYGNVTLMHTNLQHETYSTNDNRVPEAWGTLGVKWERKFGESTRLFTDLAYRMSDNYKYDGGDGQIWYEHKGGQTANFSIGVEGGEEHKYSAILSLKNLFNQEYEPDYYYSPGFHAVLSLSYEF